MCNFSFITIFNAFVLVSEKLYPEIILKLKRDQVNFLSHMTKTICRAVVREHRGLNKYVHINFRIKKRICLLLVNN